MTIEQFRTTLNALPFKPFVVHLADGREIRIEHRDFAMLSPSGRTVAIYQRDDSVNIVDLLLVTDLEIRPNGSGRRRRS